MAEGISVTQSVQFEAPSGNAGRAPVSAPQAAAPVPPRATSTAAAAAVASAAPARNTVANPAGGQFTTSVAQLISQQNANSVGPETRLLQFLEALNKTPPRSVAATVSKIIRT
ncbi:MAG TPA: hypothetical protein VEU47_00520 [Candidatus Cybelea sp.]|nr:hypothetical protein [Candidatus Cybelea sp.]